MTYEKLNKKVRESEDSETKYKFIIICNCFIKRL